MTFALISRILSIILPVFGIIALGFFYARKAQPDLSSVNRLALEVLMPLLVFSSLASKTFVIVEQWPLLVASAAVVLGSGLLAWGFARFKGESVRSFVPPMMFNNCGNMGIPLQVFAFGADGLPAAVALLVVSNTLHFTLGIWILDHKAKFRHLLVSNVMIATYLGVACAVLRPELPETAMSAMKLVGDASIPLMLLSLGARLAATTWSQLPSGVWGAIICPLTGIVSALAVAPLLPLSDQQFGMLMLFAALPPAVLNYLIAEQYKASPARVAAIVAIGNIASLVFVPLGLLIGLHPMH